MDSERKSEIQNVRRISCIVAAWNSHVLRYLEKFRGLWKIEGVKWKYLLPYYSTRNVTAFRELWPPNVNVSFPNWDAPTNHHHHGDCWEAGGMNARSKVNKKTGWPQIMRCMWKGWIQWSQRLASSHIQNAKFLNLIPDLWCSDCLLPLLQTWDPWFPFLPPWSFQGTEMLSSRLGILNMPTKKKNPPLSGCWVYVFQLTSVVSHQCLEGKLETQQLRNLMGMPTSTNTLTAALSRDCIEAMPRFLTYKTCELLNLVLLATKFILIYFETIENRYNAEAKQEKWGESQASFCQEAWPTVCGVILCATQVR